MSKILTFGIMLSSVGVGGVLGAFGSVDDRIKRMGKSIEDATKKQANLEKELQKIGDNPKRTKRITQLKTEFKEVGIELDKLRNKLDTLIKLNESFDKTREQIKDSKSKMIMAAGSLYGMQRVGMHAASFEDNVKQISITGELYKNQGSENALALAMREAAVKYGVAHEQVTAGVEKLVAQGMDPKQAQGYANLLSKVHQSTRTDMVDLSELVYTLQTKFNLKNENELMQGINALTKAGKLGQYELKMMAKGFPELGGAAASFGSKVLDGVREMGMMMQIMRAGAGTTGEADTYMRNWFSHMSAKTTQDHFEKVGIKFEQSKLKLMIDQRVSAIEASFMVFDDYLNKVTNQGFIETRDKKGNVERIDVRQELDKALRIAEQEGLKGEALQARVMSSIERMGLSSVLQDIQATQAYLAYRNGKQKYKDGKKELENKTTNQTIDNDFNEQMKLTTNQVNYMKVAWSDLMIEIGTRFSPILGSLAEKIGNIASGFTEFIQKYHEIASNIMLIGGGLAVAVSTMFALGTAISVVKLGILALKLSPLSLGFGAIVKSATWLGAVLKSGLVFGLKVAWQAMQLLGSAVLFLSRVFLLNPIGLTITAIAITVYVIYRYWTPLKSFFTKLWQDVRSKFNNTVAWFKEFPLKFKVIGEMVIDGFVNGIQRKLVVARNTIINLGQQIKGWFASTLGIQSPSRVFMGYGGYIAEGAAIGINHKTNVVRDATQQLRSAASDGWGMQNLTPPNPLSLTGEGGARHKRRGEVAPVTIHFNPTINLSASPSSTSQSTQDIKSKVNEVMQLSLRELEKMMKQLHTDQLRRAY